jgi:DNA modification methylase
MAQMADSYNVDNSTWENRVVGHDTVPPDSLLANPLNFRIHSKIQQDAIAGLLGEVGWVKSVVVNRTTGHIVDGHARVTLALRNNAPVPVEYVELSEDEERLALAALDNIVGMAGTDKEQLDALLRDVSTGDEALMGMLSEMAEDAGLHFGDEPPEESDAEPQVDRAEELREKWGVETGQLWRLPSRTAGQEHRLICGDCTDEAVVERVMGGEGVDAVVTDVPYEISQRSNGLRRLDYGEWDNEGATKVAFNALKLCNKVPTITAFCGDEQFSHILGMWADRTTRAVAWVKPNPTVLNGQHVFLPAVELAAHGRKAGAYFGGHCVRSVWEGAAPGSRSHPNQKPVKLMQWLIDNTCPAGGFVYEPFSGSGTTIIAAENLARQCRAVEISPAYVAVALQRYEDAFGITPELVTD